MAVESAPSLSTMVARIFWMLLGPLLLVVFAFQIVNKGEGWFTAADAAYLVVLGGMVVARWWEFRGGTALNSMGEPAAPADLRRYVLTAIGAGGAVWIVANLFGNHVFGGVS